MKCAVKNRQLVVNTLQQFMWHHYCINRRYTVSLYQQDIHTTISLLGLESKHLKKNPNQPVNSRSVS